MINKIIDKVDVDKINNFIDNVNDETNENNEIVNAIVIKNVKKSKIDEIANAIVVSFFNFLLCYKSFKFSIFFYSI